MLRSPKKVKQFQVGHWFASVQDEMFQEFKLRWGEMHGLTASDYTAALEINLEAWRNELWNFFRTRYAPNCCAHPRQQFLCSERLYKVIISPCIQGKDLVLFVSADSDHNDWNIRC